MREWYEQPPTEKQIKFAEAIAEKLDLELPIEETKSEYSAFISMWKDDFYGCFDDDPSWFDFMDDAGDR